MYDLELVQGMIRNIYIYIWYREINIKFSKSFRFVEYDYRYSVWIQIT